jgi:choline dehydrogenase-like flavoprotein
LIKTTTEVVVIGSGPGGSITSTYLAEAGREVLLIEEGRFLELEYLEPFSTDEMNQKYRNGGLTPTFGNPKITYVEGCCVGGGSEINSGLYHRTPPDILERWRKQYQVDALTDSEMVPHFEASERDVTVSYTPGKASPASLKIEEGGQKLSWKSMEVPRWFHYDGMQDENGTPTGTKQSMTKTFIPRFLNAGGKLITETKIINLKQIGSKWELKGFNLASLEPVEITTENVFICGGAVQTPALLRRNGIHHNIGNRLQLHPTIKITARFPEIVNFTNMGVPVHQLKEFAPLNSFGCSISSPPYLAVGMIDHPKYEHYVRDHWQEMGVYYAMITGDSYGTVRNIPGFRDPFVRYHLTEKDLNTLSDSLKKLARLLLAAGATDLFPSVSYLEKLSNQSDLTLLPNQLKRKGTSLMTIHLFSSCPMGEDKKLCATDSFGKVHGFNNLYISDASLLCSAPGVNPQGSIMAIARRNALKFLNKL